MKIVNGVHRVPSRTVRNERSRPLAKGRVCVCTHVYDLCSLYKYSLVVLDIREGQASDPLVEHILQSPWPETFHTFSEEWGHLAFKNIVFVSRQMGLESKTSRPNNGRDPINSLVSISLECLPTASTVSSCITSQTGSDT